MTDGRAYPPTAWDERSTLAAMLGYVRATAVFKCEDLAEDLAHAAPLPTPPLSSIGGFVNHLQWVEHGWFEHSTQGGRIDHRVRRRSRTESCRLAPRFRRARRWPATPSRPRLRMPSSPDTTLTTGRCGAP
jgi:hypothetical protein